MVRASDVLPFADRLLLLPLLTWRDAAMACPAQLPEETDREFVRALSDPALALDIWNARDDVETAFCRFDCAEGRALLRIKGQRDHVHEVSERAALALLVQDALCERDFTTCYGGFAKCIAVATLRPH